MRATNSVSGAARCCTRTMARAGVSKAAAGGATGAAAGAEEPPKWVFCGLLTVQVERTSTDERRGRFYL